MHTQLLIDGKWRDSSDGSTISVTDPATGEVIAEVPACTEQDVVDAIDSAHSALAEWSGRTARERYQVIRAFADRVSADAESLAQLIAREGGKPISEARGEVAYGHSFLEWSAEEAKRLYGETIPSWDPEKRIEVARRPVGVTAAITPWNFPLAMITRKLGPALAAGCVQIIKPASQTPLTALALGAMALDAGVPPGAANVITGPGARVAATLMADSRIRKVSFTGSTEVGQDLIRRSAQNVTRLSLELGGHAPTIVLADADLDIAVPAVIRAKFRNNGQSCIAANRIYVAAEIYDEFCGRFATAASNLTVGPTLQEGVDIGPLIDESAVGTVMSHISDAVTRGAQIRAGGDRAVGKGLSDLYFQPTVLVDATDDMLVFREETFGPVAAISKCTTVDEAVERANASPFGLAAYVFGRSISAIRVAERLEYGVIGVNDGTPSTGQAPFGGMKMSGYGREGGKYGVEEYLETQYLSIRA